MPRDMSLLQEAQQITDNSLYSETCTDAGCFSEYNGVAVSLPYCLLISGGWGVLYVAKCVRNCFWMALQFLGHPRQAPTEEDKDFSPFR